MHHRLVPLALSALVITVVLSLVPTPPARAVPPQPQITTTSTATATTTATATATATPLPTAPTIVTLANGYRITFLGNVTNSDATTTWSYRVEELASAQDLSNWVLGLPGCIVVAATPEPNEVVNPDPNAQIHGVKWQTGAGFTSGVFTVTLANVARTGAVIVAAKGPDVEHGTLAGPICGASAGLPPQPVTIPVVVPISTYRITFLEVVVNADGTTTWRYRVEELAGAADLTSWVLALSGCQVVSATPSPYAAVVDDPATGLSGLRWPVEAGFTRGTFSVTLANATRIGLTRVGVQSAAGVATGEAFGPICGFDDDEEETDEPPAVIIIERPAAPVVVVENGVAFVVMTFRIGNQGGRARGVFLDLDLELLELADLRFLRGAGYVREIRGNRVIIGIGQNNTIKGEDVELNLRFKVTGDRRSDQTVRIRSTLRYTDSDGPRTMEPVVIEVVVPAIVVTAPVPAPVVVTLPRLSEAEIDIRFRARWQRGGLRLYGLPLTRAVTLRSGIIVQYFERARFEYHPENEGTAYVILLGRLGVELGYSRPPAPAPTSQAELVWYFPATGHLIAAPFRSYWQNEGGLEVYGYPIGPAFVDARGLTVQYFERARLELHPEFTGTENAVLLGLLGEEALRARGGVVENND